MIAFALAAALTLPADDGDAAAAGDDRQFFELRIYRNDDAAFRDRVLLFAQAALVPALNRAGVEPVGVFVPIAEMNEGQSAADVFVLIPYVSSADFFKAPYKEPYYTRMDVSLMRAFKTAPQIAVPGPLDEDRVFEMRTYESHTEERAAKKVDMFNAGEVDVMKEVGLSPVFFAETIAASDAPNLRYMMSGPDAETHAANFQKFLDHPTWEKLKTDAQYGGTVSSMTKTFLVRAKGSQI